MPSDEMETITALAERELRETKEIRKHALKYLKEWILKNGHISNIRTDDSFLLRFLRVKKFSLPMAEQMLLKWLNLRKTFPSMCKDLNCLDPKLEEIIDNGYIFVSPFRDDLGRRVIIYNVRKFNANKFSSAEMARIHILTYEMMLDDEENQVRGVIHAADIQGICTSHISCWSPEVFARLLRWGEQSMPLRHKEIHLLNVPLAVKYVYDFAKSMVSQKMNKRIMVHNNTTSLCSKINPKCLPKEYGGSMPMDEMISRWKKELLSLQTTMQSLDKMDILSTAGILSSKRPSDLNNNPKDNHSGLSGSFRKLEID